MDHRTGHSPARAKTTYHSTARQAPPRSQPVPPVRPVPPPRSPRTGCARPQAASSYRQYAARRRRGSALRRLMYLMAAVLLAGAVFLVLNGPELLLPGAAEPESQAAAAPADPAGTEPSGFVVAVDPGHGGGDPGTEGPYFNEDEMTWETAELLMDLLEADGRFAPFLTTDGTEYERPSQRAANAVAGGAQLLLSIHGNSGDDPSYAGFECYPVPPGRTYNAESLAFAQMIADRFGQTGERLRGENGVRYIYYDANNEKQIFEVSDTTVHSAPTFTLLEECGCPAVLAEQCFITSPEDVAAFGDETGRQAAAQIYYDAICEWYETYVEAAGSDALT